LVVAGNAKVASHNNDGAFAIGGTLRDATPSQSKTVGGLSHVQQLARPHRFTFSAGVQQGFAVFPFRWEDLEYLAKTITPQAASGAYHTVHVVCRGGSFSISNLFPKGNAHGRSGYNTLVVFNTVDEVTLQASPDGRQMFASILAPFSRLVIDRSVGFVDGVIVAKELFMDSKAGSVQLHGRAYSGTMMCSASPSLCSGPAQCEDALANRRCQRKARKGKCMKRRVSQIKCRLTCGTCWVG